MKKQNKIKQDTHIDLGWDPMVHVDDLRKYKIQITLKKE